MKHEPLMGRACVSCKYFKGAQDTNAGMCVLPALEQPRRTWKHAFCSGWEKNTYLAAILRQLLCRHVYVRDFVTAKKLSSQSNGVGRIDLTLTPRCIRCNSKRGTTRVETTLEFMLHKQKLDKVTQEENPAYWKLKWRLKKYRIGKQVPKIREHKNRKKTAS